MRQTIPTREQCGGCEVSMGQAALWAQDHDVYGERGGWLRHTSSMLAIAQGWDALAAFLAYSSHKRRKGYSLLTFAEVWADRCEISRLGSVTAAIARARALAS